MQPSEPVRPSVDRTATARPRSPEEPAQFDAEVTAALQRALADRRDRERMAADFERPCFTRIEINRGLGLSSDALDNWRRRDQVPLDGGEKREGGSRLYSPRDAIRIGIAARLNELGVPGARLRASIDAIEAVMPLSPHNPYLAGNIPSVVALLGNGEVSGPHVGHEIDTTHIPAGAAFILVRIDEIVRSVFEPFGMALTPSCSA